MIYNICYITTVISKEKEMPPKAKVNKRDILNAAATVVRRLGADQLNARAVALALGTSTQPIFSHYESMDVLRRDVIAYGGEVYNELIKSEMEGGKYPAYKSVGLAYIRFAKEDSELFKLCFMRDRAEERILEDDPQLDPIIELIMKTTGYSRDLAKLFHLENWTYVHGIASMIATSYLSIDWDLIVEMLTDNYVGLKYSFSKKEN